MTNAYTPKEYCPDCSLKTGEIDVKCYTCFGTGKIEIYKAFSTEYSDAYLKYLKWVEDAQ